MPVIALRLDPEQAKAVREDIERCLEIESNVILILCDTDSQSNQRETILLPTSEQRAAVPTPDFIVVGEIITVGMA